VAGPTVAHRSPRDEGRAAPGTPSEVRDFDPEVGGARSRYGAAAFIVAVVEGLDRHARLLQDGELDEAIGRLGVLGAAPLLKAKDVLVAAKRKVSSP